MGDTQQLADVARAIIDANSYMTIGSADESGLPWVSPVWFAPVDRREFFWVSASGRDALAQHRRAPAGEHRDLRLHASRSGPVRPST